MANARLDRRVLVMVSTAIIAIGSAGCDIFQPVAPAEPTSLEAVTSRDGQSAPAGTALPQQVQVRVLDQNGEPYRKGDAQIAWTVMSGGGSVSPGTSFSTSSGIAATSWILGSTLGTQTLRAALAGVDSVTITATATTGGGQASSDSLLVGEASAAAGDTATVPVTLVNLADSGGLQFRIDFSADLRAVSVTPTAVLDGLTVAHNVGIGPGTLTVAVYGSSVDVIPAGTAVVLNLGIEVSGGTASGEYLLEVVDARISDPAGTTSTQIGRADGKVIVP